ncbi:MAG: universal stress protein [Proteobacteria bacterium]|nr:universal stress protein [Pseudomonadota bacterium]
MTTIAVAIDGTEASAAALVFAVDKARLEEARLHGVFVLDTGWADFIGNDWQSSRNARQGFLDYVRGELEKQSERARRQFVGATADWPNSSFTTLPGDPAEALAGLMGRGEADAMVLGEAVYRTCGRPSVKNLAKQLKKVVRQPLFVL